jgi:hypothetical protein
MPFYEVDRYVAVPVEEPSAEPTNGHRVELAVAQPEAPAPPLQAAPVEKRRRPRWIGSLSVGVVALIASGTLGYLTYSTTQERNAAQRDLAATQTALTAANADAATKLVKAKYVALYVKNEGKVQWDYQNWIKCDTFGACRTATQDLLNDLQAFQAAHKAAGVPADLAGVDSELSDALSAAIAADQQVINAMDNGDIKAFRAAYHRLDAAMLAIAKVETALGGQLSL